MAKLQRDAEHDVHARVVRVAQVVHAVNLDDKNVLRVQPVAWPHALKSEPVATILEAAIAVVGLADAEPVLLSEIGLVTVGGNAATTIFVGVLRLLFGLSLLVVLLLRILLFRLGVLHFLPSVLFLGLRLLRLRLFLLLLGRPVLVFYLLVVLFLLRVCGDTDPESQRENDCADSSNEFHKALPPLSNRNVCCYLRGCSSAFGASFAGGRGAGCA